MFLFRLLLWVFLGGVASVFLLGKCFFLARHRVGWLMMIANIVYETVFKRLHLTRSTADGVALLVVVAGCWLLMGPGTAVVCALGMSMAWAGVLILDGRLKSGARLAHQHRDFRGRVPMPIPDLAVRIRGAVLGRGRVFDLGYWPVGTRQEFEILVINPTEIAPQLPLQVQVESRSDRIQLAGALEQTVECPSPGDICRSKFSLQAVGAGGGADIEVRVRHGDFHFAKTLRLAGVVEPGACPPRGARIDRWRYGAEAAFAWRGDHDLYDPATFQSVAGLRVALGLARRLRFPNTLFLSGRLSLVEAEHREFCAHFGWNRHSEEIPDFERFLREEVDPRVEQEWPVESARAYSAEIGNHMYLHYGTHAAAAPGNHWKCHATIGDGTYSWLGESSRDSFAEQRDNACYNADLLERLVGVRPVSYAIPSDVYDSATAAAVEAAGMEIGSDTDASRFTRVFGLPPPHHPRGCGRFVELTRKYPRDPDDVYQVATLKYWLHAAARLGRALVFLSHHHLLRYEGSACFHGTEAMLLCALKEGAGRFHIGTVAAVGRYWRDVLSPDTRVVNVESDDHAVVVTNQGPVAQRGLPVIIDLGGGRLHMRLIDVEGKARVRMALDSGADTNPSRQVLA